MWFQICESYGIILDYIKLFMLTQQKEVDFYGQRFKRKRAWCRHVLRHTMAARCIEGNMRPKTLQVILGHSNVGITMNLYVHVTEDEKVKEVEKIERALKIV